MKPRIPEIRELIRGHFVGGLFVVLLLVVITWILGAVVETLWQLRGLIPWELRPENFLENPSLAQLFNVLIILGVTALLALGISFVGWSSKRYLGRQLLAVINEIIGHIPVVRSIYSTLEQLMRTIASGSTQQFSRVVYIEYPRKGCWALAFVTGPARGPAAPERHLNVYVPTTPNPTSGFHLIVAESEVRESQMKVEEAFRTILSLGIAQPPAQASSENTYGAS